MARKTNAKSAKDKEAAKAATQTDGQNSSGAASKAGGDSPSPAPTPPTERVAADTPPHSDVSGGAAEDAAAPQATDQAAKVLAEVTSDTGASDQGGASSVSRPQDAEAAQSDTSGYQMTVIGPKGGFRRCGRSFGQEPLNRALHLP